MTPNKPTDLINRVAAALATCEGWETPPGHDFARSDNPRAQRWATMARAVIEVLEVPEREEEIEALRDLGEDPAPLQPSGWVQKDKRFAETVFIVQATHAEVHYLWRQWHKRVKWEQDCLGHCATVGTVANLPVVVCCSWALLDGQRVMFYEATSRVVDWSMVENWVWEQVGPLKWDDNRRRAQCDTMNFAHCIHAIRSKAP